MAKSDSKNKQHALILDGDFLVFQAMSAAETEFEWQGTDIWTLECDHAKAWSILEGSVEAIRNRKKSWLDSKLVMCFTDKTNWRKDVLPTYKSNRKGTRKPVGYYEFVEKVMAYEEWNSFLRPTLEGDDCMGILATMPKLIGCDSATICSPDKDFKTIPCEFFWMTTDEILQLSEEDANYWHMYQTLTGDTTDGYSGIPGIGSETAVEFLKEPYKFVQEEKIFKSGPRKGQSTLVWTKQEAESTDSLWECILSLGRKAGMDEQQVLVQAQVARICRATDYNFNSKEVILWAP